MSNDHNPPGNGHSDDDFIMPEHDPTPSGQPVTDAVYHASNGSPSNQVVKNQSAVITQQNNQSGNAAQQIMGLTIKNKLLGSFFFLTVFIGGMGAYSYFTLVEVSSLSEIVSQDRPGSPNSPKKLNPQCIKSVMQKKISPTWKKPNPSIESPATPLIFVSK